MMLNGRILLIVWMICATSWPAWGRVKFDMLNGSDLGMGVGARAIALSGAFTALADDPSAIYWNSAGLALLHENHFMFAAEDGDDFSLAALVWKPPLPVFENIGFTLGAGYLYRLRFAGDSGEGDWSGYPSHLLDMSMIDAGDDFRGSVDSKTYDTRLSMAFFPTGNGKLALGMNFVAID